MKRQKRNTGLQNKNQSSSAERNISKDSLPLLYKDRLTIILSVIALFISATTFIIGRLDKREANEKEVNELKMKEISQNYKAFSLGQQVVRTYFFMFIIPKGEKDPQNLAKANEEAAFEVSKLQQLSEILDLRISDVRVYFTSPDATKSEVEVDPSQPYREFTSRINLTENKNTLAAFDLGYASTLMRVRSIVYDDRREAAKSVIDAYPKIADAINRDLKDLGMQKSVSSNHTTLREIEKEMDSLKVFLEKVWEH